MGAREKNREEEKVGGGGGMLSRDKDSKERGLAASSSPELNYRLASLLGMLYERCTTLEASDRLASLLKSPE